MTEQLWLSVGLGAGIGLIYGLIAVVSLRVALRVSGQQFAAIFVGGMLGRLVLVLALTVGVLLLVPVRPMPFALSLAGIVVAAMGVEMLIAFRHLKERSS